MPYGINVLDSRMQRVIVVGKSLFCECIPSGKLTEPLTNVVNPYSPIKYSAASLASITFGYGSDSKHRTASIGFCDIALIVGIETATPITATNNILYAVFIMLILYWFAISHSTKNNFQNTLRGGRN